jgi:hypothetical protein
MTEAAELDNQLSLLLSTVSEMVGVDNAEQRRRWQRVQETFPRSAGAIHALLQAEVVRALQRRRVRT